MVFSEDVVIQAWNKAGGRCECRRRRHGHYYVKCNKQLSWNNRGREGRGCWEAHHRRALGGEGLSNCEILCWECHSSTF